MRSSPFGSFTQGGALRLAGRPWNVAGRIPGSPQSGPRAWCGRWVLLAMSMPFGEGLGTELVGLAMAIRQRSPERCLACCGWWFCVCRNVAAGIAGCLDLLQGSVAGGDGPEDAHLQRGNVLVFTPGQ